MDPTAPRLFWPRLFAATPWDVLALRLKNGLGHFVTLICSGCLHEISTHLGGFSHIAVVTAVPF